MATTRLLAALLLLLAACHPPPRPAQGPPSADSLVFRAQAGWIEEAPSSSMRVAQFRLPGEGAEPASVAVFRFPGDGGSIEQNFTRWVGQFRQPDGSSSFDAAETQRFRVGGMEVYGLELAGTFVAETQPGSGQRMNRPGWAMVAAVLEASDQLVFVKATGPESTIDRWRDSIYAFLDDAAP